MEYDDLVAVVRVDYQTFRVFCQGKWKTVDSTAVGFREIEKAYPIMKVAHALACECEIKD